MNDKFILKASHCFNGAKKVQVAVGTNKKPDLSKFLDGEWIVHEKFTSIMNKNDIALIKLKAPLQFSNKVKPICLPEKNDAAKGDFTIAGWGFTGVAVSNDLIEADVKELILVVVPGDSLIS